MEHQADVVLHKEVKQTFRKANSNYAFIALEMPRPQRCFTAEKAAAAPSPQWISPEHVTQARRPFSPAGAGSKQVRHKGNTNRLN